jgi:hypothetical protein
MACIFLSASISLPHRHPRYAETADVEAILDSISALVSVVTPSGQIVFSGHPAITPLMHLLIGRMAQHARKHVILYQSLFFKDQLRLEVPEFENVRFVDAVDSDLEASLTKMREVMISSHNFDAAVFLGGMQGVEIEYDIFRRFHPGTPAYAIASTGAAARILFEKYSPDRLELMNDLHYASLFRRLLNQPSSGIVM